MKNLEICGNTFKLDDISYNFLQKYLDRINNFVKKNDLDEELYQDILQRLADKLSSVKQKNGSIKEKDCINIVNQLGEPEDIFGEIPSEQDVETPEADIADETSSKKFWEKMIKSGWTRNMDRALILGICDTIAQKTEIPVWIVRVLFILFTSAGGISIGIYLLLGIFMPIKGKDYSNKTTSQFIRFQLWALKSGLINALKALIKLIKIIFKYVFDIVLLLFKSILPILRFFFFSILGLLFLFKILFLIGLGAGIYTGFSISNVEFTSMLPDYLMIGIAIGVICLVVFMVGSFAFAFGKKILNRYLFISSVVASFFSLFFFMATGLKLFQDYSQTSTNQRILEIPLQTGSSNVSLDIGLYKDTYIKNFIGGGVYIYPSSGNNIKVVIDDKVYAKNDISQKIFSGMSDAKYESSTGYINIFNQGNQIFRSKVPFSLINRKVSVYVPSNITLNLTPSYGASLRNVQPPIDKQRYYRAGRYGCQGSEISFSTGENRFVCQSSKLEAYGRKLYIQDNLIDIVNEIAPIKHYPSRYGYNNWDVHSFNWTDNNTLTMKIYDDYLNIFMDLKVNEDNGKVDIVQKEIKNIEQKKLLKIDTYKDTSSLSGYDLNFAQ